MSQLGQFTVTGFTSVIALTGDAGGPIAPIASNINLLGSTNISSIGNPGTGTINFYLTGTTDHAIQVGNLSGGITSIALATNGQLLLGTTGGDPSFGSLGVSNGIAKTEGAGTLSIAGIQATTAQIGVVTLANDAEAIAGADSAKTIVSTSLKAKLGTQTLHGIPVGAADTAAITWTAEPSNGQILIGSTGNAPVLGTITAGTNIGVANAAGSITIKVAGTTDHALQLGNATGDLSSLGVGTTGTILTGVTGADPAWTTATYPATIAIGEILCATGANVIGVVTGTGVAGEVLTSTGPGSVPTWQAGGGGGAAYLSTAHTDGADAIVALSALSFSGTANKISTSGAGATVTITVPSNPSFDGTTTVATGLTATAGNIQASAGALSASTTVTAGTTSYATTFDTNIVAAKLQIAGTTITSAGTDANVGLTITPKGTGGVTVTTGNIAASSGAISASTTVTAGTTAYATTFDTNVAAAKLQMAGTTLTATGSDANVGLTITTKGTGNITVTTGDVSLSSGNLLLPNTSATVGQIKINSNVVLHQYGASSNVFVGDSGNFTLTGANALQNIGVGHDALKSLDGSGGAEEGSRNVAVGESALTGCTSGKRNACVGHFSGNSLTTGSYNTFFGHLSGYSSLTTGGYNVFLGNTLGGSYILNESSNILIGYNISGTVGEDNVLRIGDGTGTGTGQLNKAYISGIYNKTVGATAGVMLCDSADLVGGLAGAAGTILVGGTKPAWDATPSGLTSLQATTLLATTFDTNVAAAGLTLSGTTLSADGTDVNIDITITPKGTGVISTAKNINAAGISFDSGTNTLNDYVAQTSWTPSLTFSGGSTGITYTTQTGYYSRVGNIIFYSGTITLSSKGSSTGTIRIGSLPATPASHEVRGLCTAGEVSYTGDILTILAASGVAYFNIGIGTQAGAALALMDDTMIENTAAFRFSGFYFVA